MAQGFICIKLCLGCIKLQFSITEALYTYIHERERTHAHKDIVYVIHTHVH